jgi:magnesium-transporting ATPase (P-type)
LVLQGEHAKGRTAETVPQDTVVKVLHRHHFSSKLQRMSVVATVKGTNEKGEQLYVLAKGSPEMIKTLLSITEDVCLSSAASCFCAL